MCRNFALGLGVAYGRLLTVRCPVDFQIKGSFTGKRSEEAFNPYGQGNVISNCLDVLCGPTYPSLIGKSPRPVPLSVPLQTVVLRRAGRVVLHQLCRLLEWVSRPAAARTTQRRPLSVGVCVFSRCRPSL